MNIRPEFVCPISIGVMVDPYSCPNGHNFDKTAIDQWLRNSASCPTCKCHLVSSMLVRNLALKNLIESNGSPTMATALPLPQKCTVTKPVHVSFTQHPSGEILATVSPPQVSGHVPTVVVAVIDVSGSMSAIPQLTGDSGEQNNLDVLQIAGQVVYALGCSMSEQDLMAVVSYTDYAKIELLFTSMNDEGKEQVKSTVRRLQPTSMTNIWAGLQKALDILQKAPAGYKKHIFLLTDGDPTMSPSRGEKKELERYLAKNNITDVTMDTFGFGSSMNGELMDDMARMLSGNFYYIPGIQLLATNFVHANANLGTQTAHSVVLNAGNKTYNLSTLHSHQDRTVILEPGTQDIVLEYTPVQGTKQVKTIPVTITSPINVTDFTDAQCRRLFINFLNEAILYEDVNKAYQKVVTLGQTLRGLDQTPFVKAVMKTVSVKGQCYIACSSGEYLRKWGLYYFRMLKSAHESQVATNFKDEDTGNYTSELFETLYDYGDEIFNSLSMPDPRTHNIYTPSPSRFQQSAPVYDPISVPSRLQSQAYNRSSDPCFASENKITMADGTTKQLSQVQSGDHVKVPAAGRRQESTTKVKCVLRTVLTKGLEMTKMGNLFVTPWHPVYVQGTWVFPVETKYETKVHDEVKEIFSLFLESGHIAEVEGFPVICLAHHFDDPVLKHDYFGDKIEEDLSRFPDFQAGYITFSQGAIDTSSGFKFKEEHLITK
jgi:hypothetical protein